MTRTQVLREVRRMRFAEAYGGWQERRLTQEEAARLLGGCMSARFGATWTATRTSSPSPCPLSRSRRRAPAESRFRLERRISSEARAGRRTIRHHRAQPACGRTDPVHPTGSRQGALRDRRFEGIPADTQPRRSLGAENRGGSAQVLMPFVLDCSTTMAWVFPDEASEATGQLRDSLIEDRAFVPSLWPRSGIRTVRRHEHSAHASESKTANDERAPAAAPSELTWLEGDQMSRILS